MANENNIAEIFGKVDAILSKVDLSKTTAESAGFEDLEQGYYLCEVLTAELTESKKQDPQIKLTLSVVQDGVYFDEEDNMIERPHSKGRRLYKYYPLKDEMTVKRFVSDMLKFEDENGDPILPQEAFTSAETLSDALDVITGMQVYVNLTVSGEKESRNTWISLLAWSRVDDLGIK